MSQEYTPVFNYNFTKSFDTKSFEYKISADGYVSRNSNGLTINSSKYTAHVSPGINGLMDHFKWCTFLCKAYKIHEGEFIYEACMSAKQIISPSMIPLPYRNRIRNIKEDYRLCSSGLVVYDEENMITIKILFTDDWIYGYYERRPGCKSSWSNLQTAMGDYAAFTSIIPLCKRGNHNSLEDVVRVGIGIDACKGTIKFYINRNELFCIPRIGYRLADEYQVSELGGTPYITNLECMRFGFGNFSYLDHNIPNNYARQYVVETLDSNGYSVHRLASGLAQLLPSDKYREPYPDFTGEYTSIDPNLSFGYTGNDPSYFNFGQGIITHIKYISGYIINNRVKMYKMLCNDSFDCFQQTCDATDSQENSDDLSISDLLFDRTDCKPAPKKRLKDLFHNNNINYHKPLYQDYSVSNSESSIESYSLGDLYLRSKNRKYIPKGESYDDEIIIFDKTI